jgi:hypothetical protein
MQVVAWMTRDGHCSELRRMTEVTVTSGLANLSPAVDFDELDDGTYCYDSGP